MLELAKFIHFLSFSIGIGGGVAGMVIGTRTASAPIEARPILGRIQGAIGRVSFIALVMLWITGLYMIYSVYGGWGAFGTVLWLKIAAVVGLTLAAIALQYNGIRAAAARLAPPPKRMAMLGALATLCAILALLFSVLAFD